jgi:hypothetical protein
MQTAVRKGTHHISLRKDDPQNTITTTRYKLIIQRPFHMLATSVENTDLQKQGDMYSTLTTNSIRLTKMESQRHPTPSFVLGRCYRPSSADICTIGHVCLRSCVPVLQITVRVNI